MHRIKWFCFLLVGIVAIHLFPGKAMGNATQAVGTGLAAYINRPK